VRYVLDSSVLIDLLRARSEAVDLLVSITNDTDELWGVTPTRTEILGGMRPIEEERTRALLDLCQWQDITVEVADLAAAMARQWRSSHGGIGTVDYLIAAGTSLIGGRLLTLNTRHFPMIEGLEPPYR
jgi:predicted nucleic acid-binding protein